MIVLAIDTSCDETSVAVTQKRRVIANVIFSQINLHKPYGGVYPTIAKREHKTKIMPAVHLALKRARLDFNKINAVAVTFGPGLAPALEIGIDAAKHIALSNSLPLIPIDHIEGHIFSAFVQNKNGIPKREITYPFIALIVSGGHTELILIKDTADYTLLGQTRDDAAGEALDKASRLLGLGYPGGPILEQLSKKGNALKYPLPIPMQRLPGLDFSYSGLKTALKRLLSNIPKNQQRANIANIASSFQQSVIKSLLIKLKRVLIQHNNIKYVVLAGGVASNAALRTDFRNLVRSYNKVPITPPKPYLFTDNAAMIGVAAYLKYKKKIVLRHKKEILMLERIARTELQHYTKSIK